VFFAGCSQNRQDFTIAVVPVALMRRRELEADENLP
jgi:hypothetical protein